MRGKGGGGKVLAGERRSVAFIWRCDLLLNHILNVKINN